MPRKQGYKAPVLKPSPAGLGLVKVRPNPEQVATLPGTTRSLAKNNSKNPQKGPRFAR